MILDLTGCKDYVNVNDNAWHRISVIKAGNEVKVFVDGLEQDEN